MYWGRSDASGDEGRLSTKLNLGSHLDFDIYQLGDVGQILNLLELHLEGEGCSYYLIMLRRLNEITSAHVTTAWSVGSNGIIGESRDF